MNDHRGRRDGHRPGLMRPFRMDTSRILIAAPVLLLAVGCGALQAVGNFPNPKDTETVYVTPPPQTPAKGVAATAP
jgi:hypothetical protein